MQKLVVIIVTVLCSMQVAAQTMTVYDYIATYKDAAIEEMHRSGVPASITLAQGLLETESGNSDLVRKSNNHFGIKCKTNWIGQSVNHTDDAPNECFRKYNSARESFEDHSNFLKNSQRYANLFSLPVTDYRGWAVGLKNAGYATNPRYPQILIKNIEQYNLQQYDQLGTGFQSFESITFKNEDVMPMFIAANTGVDNNRLAKQSSAKFNGLKAVFANAGTSLLAIATSYNISLSRLLEYNDFTRDGILHEAQFIYLERKAKEGNRDLYTALASESLLDASQNNGIQLEYLAKYNGKSADARLTKGETIKLKETAEVPIANSANVQVLAQITHEVLPKEGLYSIAKKYNCSVAEIMEWNNLSAQNLSVGQKLIIAK